MVDIIEVNRWTSTKDAFVIDVKSLEDLRRIAEGYGVPYIFRKGKEHIVICGQELSVPVIYKFKK